jgi:hypothetical protein
MLESIPISPDFWTEVDDLFPSLDGQAPTGKAEIEATFELLFTLVESSFRECSRVRSHAQSGTELTEVQILFSLSTRHIQRSTSPMRTRLMSWHDESVPLATATLIANSSRPC